MIVSGIVVLLLTVWECVGMPLLTIKYPILLPYRENIADIIKAFLGAGIIDFALNLGRTFLENTFGKNKNKKEGDGKDEIIGMLDATITGKAKDQ
jgi:hypothetical protein